MAAVGVGILILAQVILFCSHVDAISNTNKASAVFGLLGFIALVTGLTLSSILQPGLSWGARIALLLGAAFIVVTHGVGVANFVNAF